MCGPESCGRSRGRLRQARQSGGGRRRSAPAGGSQRPGPGPRPAPPALHGRCGAGTEGGRGSVRAAASQRACPAAGPGPPAAPVPETPPEAGGRQLPGFLLLCLPSSSASTFPFHKAAQPKSYRRFGEGPGAALEPPWLLRVPGKRSMTVWVQMLTCSFLGFSVFQAALALLQTPSETDELRKQVLLQTALS